jgi:hypothetical protein
MSNNKSKVRTVPGTVSIRAVVRGNRKVSAGGSSRVVTSSPPFETIRHLLSGKPIRGGRRLPRRRKPG